VALAYRFDRKEKASCPLASIRLFRWRWLEERHAEARNYWQPVVDPMAQRKAEKTEERSPGENSFQSVTAQWLEHWPGGEKLAPCKIRSGGAWRPHILPCLEHGPCGD